MRIFAWLFIFIIFFIGCCIIGNAKIVLGVSLISVSTCFLVDLMGN